MAARGQGLATAGGSPHDHAAIAHVHDEHTRAVDHRTQLETADDAARLAALILRIAPDLAQIEATATAIAAQVDAASSRVLTEAGKSPLLSQFEAIRYAAACASAIQTHAIPAAVRLAGLA